jgi:hypothetical protein
VCWWVSLHGRKAICLREAWMSSSFTTRCTPQKEKLPPVVKKTHHLPSGRTRWYAKRQESNHGDARRWPCSFTEISWTHIYLSTLCNGHVVWAKCHQCIHVYSVFLKPEWSVLLCVHQGSKAQHDHVTSDRTFHRMRQTIHAEKKRCSRQKAHALDSAR